MIRKQFNLQGLCTNTGVEFLLYVPEKFPPKFSMYSLQQLLVPFLMPWVIILNILAV